MSNYLDLHVLVHCLKEIIDKKKNTLFNPRGFVLVYGCNPCERFCFAFGVCNGGNYLIILCSKISDILKLFVN